MGKQTDAFGSGKSAGVITAAGPLAGRTILRFAHAFETGGGTERYLDDLDRALLDRNAMTIVRLHLTRHRPAKCSEESIGLGTLIRVPLQINSTDSSATLSEEHSFGFKLKQLVRDWVLYNPLIWRAGGDAWTRSRPSPRQPGQAVGAGTAAEETMRTRPIDLAVLHFFGGSDADEVVSKARDKKVPFAVINHYSNDRWLHLAIRKHAMLANGVAGVNGLGLPRYMRGQFENLSDGIDTEFFRRRNARPLTNLPSYPIILLPARVVREKGAMDLVRAVAALRASHVDCGIVFAGRIDSSDFVQELRNEIARLKLGEWVRFLGDVTVVELRDWYSASAVVAFPTYHHEGLGRVIVEAQAMETPVVAYATGGVPEAIESGTTGFLVPTGDVVGLTNRLRELLASPALRKSMGDRGRLATENRFSLAALADRHERFYVRVIAEAKSVRPAVPPGNP